MREIKFRALDKLTKIMFGVKSIHFANSVVRAESLTFYHIDDVELMQYTGLKDKNGVEIYEGDICMVDGGLSDYWYVVEWIYGGFQAVTYKKKDSNVRGVSSGFNSFYIEPDEVSIMNVIGNIYENPELLEEI